MLLPQLIINGGTVDVKQFRTAGGVGLSSFQQSGGNFILRGRFKLNTSAIASVSDIINATISATRDNGPLNNAFGTFNLNETSNIFAMSGGTISIYDVCGTGGRAFEVFSSPSNINVTGGTVKFIPTTGGNDGGGIGNVTPWLISSNASFGNLTIDRPSSASIVQLNTGYPALTVLNNLTLLTTANFFANNIDVSIGGNFSVGSSSTYNSGTNTTNFNGISDQTVTIDGTINNGATGLRNLTINKTAGKLAFAGTQTSLTAQGTFDLTKGTFDDNGKTLFVKGNVTNSGTHNKHFGNW